MSSAFILRDSGTCALKTEGEGGEAVTTQSGELSLAQKVVELLHSTPSALVLAELAAIDPNTLPRPTRIDYLTAIERQDSWIQALMH